VQHSWGWLVRTAATSPDGYPEPDRPDDDELPGFLAEQTRALTDALARAGDAGPVWTWAPQQDVGFVLRRQAQEATVHRVDAEQVLGEVTPRRTARWPPWPARQVTSCSGGGAGARSARSPWTATPTAPTR
jgi:hypothetical protein